MKLTTAQKEVIQKMREGWKLSVIRPNRFNKRKTSRVLFESSNLNEEIKVARSTVDVLASEDILRLEMNINQDYYLTELGKTIQL